MVGPRGDLYPDRGDERQSPMKKNNIPIQRKLELWKG